MSYHAEWIVALIGRRMLTNGYGGRKACDAILLRHVRAMFNGD